MTEFYTIESADDSVPIDPDALRELRDLLREDEELDLGLKLRDRQPAPGEQGAIPVALEIITAATPLGTAFASALGIWIAKHRGVSISVSRKGDGTRVKLSGATAREAERLLVLWERGGNGAQPGDDV